MHKPVQGVTARANQAGMPIGRGSERMLAASA